jgi:phenylalanyl-tRNA synthetase beta chain
VLTAAGFDEAMTVSAVDASWSELPFPWSDAQPLRCSPPVLRRCDALRQSLVPSLLEARRTNEAMANARIELFEVAHVYLPQGAQLPREEAMLALTSGKDFLAVKGVVETIVRAVAPAIHPEILATGHELLDEQRSCELHWEGELLGYLGEVTQQGLNRFQLREPTTVAELKLSALLVAAQLVPKYRRLSPYPSVSRDRNVVFDESVRWADVERIVRACGGQHLERVEYQETYRDEQRLGKGKKSLLFCLTLRSHGGTLTHEEADALCQRIDERLGQELGGRLRA